TRLAHGAELFRAGLAPRIIVAGGLTGDATRTEADAGADHLLALGVPAAAILREGRSRHTLENLSNVRDTLRQQGWHRLLVVSDPLHLARVAALARGLGLEARCSPARGATPGGIRFWLRALREAHLLHWYHAGVAYSRLTRNHRYLARVT
ncbi:MAG TPA: YdcF family protein, partial [Thermoanaerobaculia bacterium]|nr:YdcF family protein [Thermoanaerobaculia bacterium]